MSKHKSNNLFVATCLLIGGFTITANQSAVADDSLAFQSTWPEQERVWIGPEYWANRLQDWRVSDGRLECLTGYANKPMRTVHLVPYRLGKKDGDLTISVRTGVMDSSNKFEGTAYNAATGFLIGAGGESMDHRAALLIHNTPGPGAGFFAGMDGSGKLFIRDFEKPLTFGEKAPPGSNFPSDRETAIYRGNLDDVILTLKALPKNGKYQVTLTAQNTGTGKTVGTVKSEISKERFVGNLALVSHPGGRQKSDRYWFRDWDHERRKFEKWASATARFWYRDWKVSGSKLTGNLSQSVGPILSTQYTVHEQTLKLTAQFFPISPKSNLKASLQIRDKKNVWQTIAESKINTYGYTAAFRVNYWEPEGNKDYRIAYSAKNNNGKPTVYTWEGNIRKDPADKENITVAAFTGNMMARGGYEYPLPYGVDPPFPAEIQGQPVTESNTYLWDSRIYFPHNEVTQNVYLQNPDLLFFSGDQVYEGNPTRAVESPVEEAHLDYLYKWYLWCWTWRDLTKNIPTVTIPDDHDIYQRNIWGDGGAFSPEGDLDGSYGGYFMPTSWINMIQRTQTSHLPDPVHPEPVKNGIEVYYTNLTVGRIGFAIIEDRKFKSFPSIVKAEMSRDSHITQVNYDTNEADIPEASLLGEKQQQFLRDFALDWESQDMKALLSQTIFANLQILNKRNDNVPQQFAIPLDRDLDSNGWPQTGRRRALQSMRLGFMFHIAGDQHLASTIHHGTDEWGDACWSICVPSVANYYARSWNPQYKPEDYKPGMPEYTGAYEDGFHNKLTVKAVANPNRDPNAKGFREPMELYGEMPGYGIIHFNKKDRTINMACWPRYANPQSGKPYNGWPITINQEDNYARKAVAWLPTIEVEGSRNPVVQIVNESNEEIVYGIRISGKHFQPKVFAEGNYTIKVGDLPNGKHKTFTNVAAKKKNRDVLKVSL